MVDRSCGRKSGVFAKMRLRKSFAICGGCQALKLSGENGSDARGKEVAGNRQAVRRVGPVFVKSLPY